MSVIRDLFLGVDWGTHSSKWAADIITENGKTIKRSNLIKSDLKYHGDNIVIDPSYDYFPEVEPIHSLKRKIINDPHGAFWEFDDRKDIGMSLGKGVVFSFCSLLGDFLLALERKELSLNNSTNIEIGFSFPNWLKDKDSESITAVNNYHEAIVVSSYLFITQINELPVPHKPYPIVKWRELIHKAKKELDIQTEDKIIISNMTSTKYNLSNYTKYNQSHFGWRYLVESCAAGLPYLRNIELISPPGFPELGKLLVIDIGAGSTDIGYMLRTISTNGNENLFYFPPAPTLPIAGDYLSKEIKDYHDATGKSITFAEAEAFKITRNEEWIDKHFVDNWRKNISKHVKEYIKILQDKLWLDTDVALHIIITGGSGIVSGLSEEIESGVTEGLKERGLSTSIAERIITIDKVLSGWQFDTKEDYARMAVAIGCSDQDKPSLKHIIKMDPPTPRSTYTPLIKYKE